MSVWSVCCSNTELVRRKISSVRRMYLHRMDKSLLSLLSVSISLCVAVLSSLLCCFIFTSTPLSVLLCSSAAFGSLCIFSLSLSLSLPSLPFSLSLSLSVSMSLSLSLCLCLSLSLSLSPCSSSHFVPAVSGAPSCSAWCLNSRALPARGLTEHSTR